MKNRKLTHATKRVVAVAAAAAMTMTAVPAFAAEDAGVTQKIYYGDVDENGSVEAVDALAVLKHVVKLEMITSYPATELADMDDDGDITATDALEILKTVVGLVEKKEWKIADPATDAPTDTPEPTETAEPTPTPTVDPNATPTPAPTINPAWLPAEIPAVEPGTPYAGVKADVAENGLNGATVDETTGIITYTDANKQNAKGVQFVNPLAGRTELRQTVEEALAGQPDINTLTSSQTTIFDPEAVYPKPVWSNGVSYSFWLKADWRSAVRPDTYPLFVLTQNETYYIESTGNRNEKAPENFTLMVTMMGKVRFESGDTPHNSFRAESNCVRNAVNHDWNYYTITIANDWITVYVNGQEMVYKSVALNKDKGCKYFNDGFMTRYSTIGAPTEEDAKNDIRDYIDPFVGDLEAGLIGNTRYANPGYFDGNETQLLVNYATDPKTQLWIGGTQTSKLLSPMQDMGPADYQLKSGTQVADVQGYDKELTAEEVAANYATAIRPDGQPVTPAHTEEPAE